ncbi:MAG TPA: preprotein translocase subunit SecG [Sneathiellales bacterium]|nr:preprotein translocase subunit SecG [Sneathiellales bacterium]
METVILVIHILLAVTLVGAVLLQRSEGGGLGMGGGGAGSGGGLISTRAAADLLTRATAVLAACFMLTSIALSILAANRDDGLSVLDETAIENVIPNEPSEPEFPSVPLSN